MPSEQFAPRSFTPVSLRVNAPAASRMYGISDAREWILPLRQARQDLLEYEPVCNRRLFGNDKGGTI
jgi:hypothetical protein